MKKSIALGATGAALLVGCLAPTQAQAAPPQFAPVSHYICAIGPGDPGVTNYPDPNPNEYRYRVNASDTTGYHYVSSLTAGQQFLQTKAGRTGYVQEYRYNGTTHCWNWVTIWYDRTA